VLDPTAALQSLSRGLDPETRQRVEDPGVRKREILARAVPGLVERYVFTGFSSSGQVVYGPRVLPKTAQVVLSDVPAAVTRIQVDYIFGETVLGRFEAPVNFAVNPNPVFNDPDFVTVSTLTNLVVQPSNVTLPVGGAQAFTANSTFSDGRSYTLTTQPAWSSSNATVASVNASGFTVARAQGAAQITALVMGVSSSATFTVLPAGTIGLTLTPVNASVAVGNTVSYGVTAVSTDGTSQNVTGNATFTSSNPAVASFGPLGPNGTATALSGGTTTVTARVGNMTATTQLAVAGPAIQSLTVSPPGFEIRVFSNRQFAATATYADGSQREVTNTVVWTNSEPLRAAVGPTGLVTGLFVGEATITASLGSLSASSSGVVTDRPDPPPPTSPFVLSTPSGFEDISATASLAFALGDEQVQAAVPIGFTFPYGSATFTTINVCSNGYISFTSVVPAFSNVVLPVPGGPDLIAAYWDDLFPPPVAGVTPWVFVETLGVAPNRRCVIQWNNAEAAGFAGMGSITFELVLFEGGNAEARYQNTIFAAAGGVSALNEGRSATAGFQNTPGTRGATYCANGAPNLLLSNTRVQFRVQNVLP